MSFYGRIYQKECDVGLFTIGQRVHAKWAFSPPTAAYKLYCFTAVFRIYSVGIIEDIS